MRILSMEKENKYPHISSIQKDQMLKLIAKSFYRELVSYGITKGNVVSISTNLLDCIMQTNEGNDGNSEHYDLILHVNDIGDDWSSRRILSHKDVSLVPINEGMYSKIISWLKDPAIANSLYSMLPASENTLKKYFEKENNQYFAILYKNNLEGVIGADEIDSVSQKLEMKKFIGNYDLRGKGIGKQATFLFLYYVFVIMKYNKIYIYTLNTNLMNINLNSKFGFILEGILYQEKKILNELQDVVRMGMIRESWEKIFMNGFNTSM